MTLVPLGDIRVVELSTGIAGGYAAKLFADAGADVVKVEAPTGDPLREWSASGGDRGGRDGALFRFLAAGQQSVVIGGDLDAHCEGRDVVVVSSCEGSRMPGDGVQLAAAHPEAVVVSLTPFGLTGPCRADASPEFLLQARSGSPSPPTEPVLDQRRRRWPSAGSPRTTHAPASPRSLEQ